MMHRDIISHALPTEVTLSGNNGHQLGGLIPYPISVGVRLTRVVFLSFMLLPAVSSGAGT